MKNSIRNKRFSRKRLSKKHKGGSPAYRLLVNQGLLTQSSLDHSQLGLTTHENNYSDHIISTSGGGRRYKGINGKRRRSLNKRRSSLNKRMSSLKKRRSSLNKRMSSLKKRRSSLNKRRKSFNKRRNSFNKYN